MSGSTGRTRTRITGSLLSRDVLASGVTNYTHGRTTFRISRMKRLIGWLILFNRLHATVRAAREVAR